MTKQSTDLHGNVPDQSPVALLLIDVINDMEFEGGDKLFEFGLPAARNIARLKKELKKAGIPCVYANDNFGRWQSNLRDVVDHCLNDGVRGAPIVRLLEPEDDDYVVLKPKHSAFFASPLDLLVQHLGAQTLILAGFAGDICVLATAADAHLREYRIYVPSDCSASLTMEENEAALVYMQRVYDADLTPSTRLDIAAILETRIK